MLRQLKTLSVTILRFGVILFKNCHDSVIVVQVPLFFFFFLFCNVPALYSKFSAGAVCTVHVWFHGVWNCIELLDSLKCFFVAVKQIVTEFYSFKDSETQHYHNIYITTASRRYADMSEWLTVVRVWFCLFLPCFIEHPVYLWLVSLCLRAVWRGEAGFQLQPHCSHLFLIPCNQPGY